MLQSTKRIIATGLCLLTFVVHAKNRATPVVVLTNASSISGCRLVQEISVNSGYAKHYNWRRHVRRKALLQAEQSGATHLVVDGLESIGAFNGKAHALAYRCRNKLAVTEGG